MLELRENLINLIKRYQTIFDFSIKFIAGIFIYAAINSIGYYGAGFGIITTGFSSVLFILFMSVIFAIMPMNVNYILMILYTTIQFSNQLEIALVVFIALVAMYLFYGHFSKKEGTLIIATLMAFYFRIPYIIPILAGLYFGITSIIPIAIGVFIWSYGYLVVGLVSAESVAGLDIDTITSVDLDDIISAFTGLQESIMGGSEHLQNMIVLTVAMFMIFIFVYIVSKLSINSAKEIAIGLGTVLNMILFTFVSFFSTLPFNVFLVILLSAISGGMMYLFSFYDIALDYEKAEKVEFQDEDFYYQVKMIPKRKVAEKRVNVTPNQTERQRGSGNSNIR